MKQPKKLKKQQDLKKRLETVRSTPESDINFTVTVSAQVYRALEVIAGGDVPAWVAQMLTQYVEHEGLMEELDEE